jgi:hypothetical protein
MGPGFDFRRYQVSWKVVRMEWVPLILGATWMKEVVAPVYKSRGDPLRWPCDTPLSEKVYNNFCYHRRPLSRYNSLEDYKVQSFFACNLSTEPRHYLHKACDIVVRGNSQYSPEPSFSQKKVHLDTAIFRCQNVTYFDGDIWVYSSTSPGAEMTYWLAWDDVYLGRGKANYEVQICPHCRVPHISIKCTSSAQNCVSTSAVIADLNCMWLLLYFTLVSADILPRKKLCCWSPSSVGVSVIYWFRTWN